MFIDERKGRRTYVVCTTLTAKMSGGHFATWLQCVCRTYKAMFTHTHKGYPTSFYVHFCLHRLNLLSQIESRVCLRQKLKQHGCSMFAPHEKPCLRTKEEFKGTPLEKNRGCGDISSFRVTQRKRSARWKLWGADGWDVLCGGRCLCR